MNLWVHGHSWLLKACIGVSLSLSSVCTADEQFVFAVYRKSFNPEVNPASLVLAGDQSCLPVLCTPDYAIFKFPVTGCGTRTFVSSCSSLNGAFQN
ncbi:UNVERIFIED_CONTAM: hypothetical protein FKN15_066043 [Acipenser sinensis]